MSVKPIDQQLTVLNSVQESKNQQIQNNRGQDTNQYIQGSNQNEVEKNRTRVTNYDSSQGQKVNEDENKEKNQQQGSPQRKKRKKKKNTKKPENKDVNAKGSRLDIRI